MFAWVVALLLMVVSGCCHGRFFGPAADLGPVDSVGAAEFEQRSAAAANELLYLTSKHAKENEEWGALTQPRFEQLLGQVSGVAATKDVLYIFHRGNASWREDSFTEQNVYRDQDRPIGVDTVLAVDMDQGELMFAWGKDRFYMPHGISVDPQGNLWLTDVALHQVFRYKSNNFERADLVLGERFVPGQDAGHFCKPTDVAIASTGTVFISDGYCNSRLIVFTAAGRYLSQFGTNDRLAVPHSLALLELEDLICVADRENQRILCYSAGLSGSPSTAAADVVPRPAGLLLFELERAQLGLVYGIGHVGDVILALNGGPGAVGVSIDLGTEQVVDVWSPRNGSFYDAHDLTVSPDGRCFFVAQLSARPNVSKVVKFDLDDYPVFLAQ